MKTEIICKDYHMRGNLEEVIERKLAKLDKYFPDEGASAKVVLTKQSRNCKMEVSIYYGRNTIRAEVEGKTMYYNIDSVMPKLERQILKYREKIFDKRKQPADIAKNLEFITDVPEQNAETYEIAKTKRFPLEAIELKEAIVNLELSGHDFYMFLNVATNQVELVYRRHDGKVGHLQPYVE